MENIIKRGKNPQKIHKKEKPLKKHEKNKPKKNLYKVKMVHINNAQNKMCCRLLYYVPTVYTAIHSNSL